MFLRKLPVWAWFLLCSERGEVPEKPDDGPQIPEGMTLEDGGESTEGSPEEPPEEPQAASEEDEVPAEIAEGQKLPPELEKHRSGMHRAYTKALEKLRAKEGATNAELEEFRRKSDVINKFHNDPNYAQEVVQQWAEKAGYKLTRAEAAQVAAQATEAESANNMPPDFVEVVKTNLPEELQAFAPAIAQANWAAQKKMLEPIMQRAQEEKERIRLEQEAERSTQVSSSLESLAAEAPGWEEHEDEMIEILDFIQSSDLSHKKWGNKAKLLYNLVTGGAEATEAATERMRQAARHKTNTPQGSKGPTSLAEKIKGAESDDEAWQLATQRALSEHPDG